MSSQHIYDVPGPRAQARNRVLAAATILVVAAILGFIVYRFAVTGQFSAKKWSIFSYQQIWAQIGYYMLQTLKAFALSAVLALVLSVVLALGRLSDHRWVKVVFVWFLEIFRAVPVLILMMLMYYGLPSVGVKVTPFSSVVVALTLYNATIIAEAIRSGIIALPRGQSEAGYALGMRKYQVMTHLLLPQAFRSMLPVIIAQLVVILKDTALGFIITYKELLYYAKALGTQIQFDAPLIPASMVIGTIYVGMCMIVAALAKLAEQRISGSRDRSGRRRFWGNTNLQIARTRAHHPDDVIHPDEEPIAPRVRPGATPASALG